MAQFTLNHGVAPVDVPVTRFIQNTPRTTGAQIVTSNNTLRSSRRGQKRSWTLTTNAVNATKRTAIMNATVNARIIPCAGDNLGGTVNCMVSVVGDERVTRLPPTVIRWIMTLAIEEA